MKRFFGMVIGAVAGVIPFGAAVLVIVTRHDFSNMGALFLGCMAGWIGSHLGILAACAIMDAQP